jgi:hypothetical protein
MAYEASWQATDQVPMRAVASGAISRFGLIDASDHGRSDRQSLAADLQRSGPGSSLRATLFVLRNRVDLFSNFTYFLDDPEAGDQFEQAERRVAAGGRLAYRRLGQLRGRPTESAVGLQLRQDWLDPVGLYAAAGGRRTAATREDRVAQSTTGVFAQSEIEWTRHARTTVGLRADVYRFSVTSDTPANSGDGSDGLVSPKLGAVLGPWAGSELYVNAGLGFHSNDARGATMRVDPATGEPAERVTPLVRARGAEVGLRSIRLPGVQATVSLWYLDLESELLFVGDAGTTQAGRPSRRAGVEWTAYWRLRPSLTADADVSVSRARFSDDDPVGDRIPGALSRVVSAGLTAEARRPVFGSVRLRHFGPRPLVEDGRVRSASTTVWNGEIGYRFSTGARLVVEAFNLLDARVADIDYYYVSRLPGEPPDGVADVHTHPAPPRSARVTLQLVF